MPNIQCFLMEKTGRVQQALERSSYSDTKCPAANEYGWSHWASVVIAEIETDEYQDRRHGDSTTDWPHDDPRWPTKCACGYEFQEGDDWELAHTPIYRRADTGELRPLFPHEPGQMWWVPWGPQGNPGSVSYQQRGGGPHLMCNTPGGTWDLDAVASNGPGWEWSGEPPNVTARPSILMHGDGYHGWLTNGVLRDA